MPPDTLQTLRQVNEGLSAALRRLRPEQMHCSTIEPRDFSDLLGEILRAAECLQTPSLEPGASVAIAKETAEYRGHLEALKLLLPELHGNLLAEKSRLETAQTHIAVAAAWARASTRTL